MKSLVGAHGTWTGLILRMAQCLFSVGPISSLATTKTFLGFTAFCYLIASMGLQVIWSFVLAVMDVYALSKKEVTATLSFTAAASSAGITMLYFGDMGGCYLGEECTKHQMAVALAFLSWITMAMSSLIMFWLVAAG